MVAVTGWGRDNDRAKNHQAGFDRHLVKPVPPQEMMDLLAEFGSDPIA